MGWIMHYIGSMARIQGTGRGVGMGVVVGWGWVWGEEPEAWEEDRRVEKWVWVSVCGF